MPRYRQNQKKRHPNKLTRNGNFTEQDLMHDKEKHEHQAKKKEQILEPLNPKQEKYIKAIKNNQLVVVLGPAGTGKTYIPCIMACDMFTGFGGRKSIRKIVLARPMEGPGRHIGTLPGDKNEKMMDWLLPLTSTIKSRLSKSKFELHLKRDDIELCALNQIKGRSFDDSFIIIDEAEDMDIETIKSVVTRIGQGNKVIINGDIKQKHIKTDSGLGWLLYLIRKYKMVIPIIEFEIQDCVRSDLTRRFLEVFEMEEEEKRASKNTNT